MVIKYWWLVLAIVSSAVAMLVVWFVLHKRVKGKKTQRAAKPLANTIRIRQLAEYKGIKLRYRLLLIVTMLIIAASFIPASLLAGRLSSVTIDNPSLYNRDIMLCLDVSGSMISSDALIVEKFKKITSGLKKERVGLTIFISSGAAVFPLTDDYDFIAEQLDYAQKAFTRNEYDYDNMSDQDYYDVSEYMRYLDGTGMGDGSFIGDGIASCVLGFDRLDQERSRSIVLATDNEVTGHPTVTTIQAAEMAKSRQIRIYSINPNDYSTMNDPPYVEEFRRAVALTDGVYYEYSGYKDEPDMVPSIIDQILKQEAAQFEGAPRIIENDAPFVPFLVASIATLGLVVILWRLKL